MTDLAIPGYELADTIGRGRLGVVYRARQAGVDREVAVRVGHAALDDGDRRRFLREARAVERLSAHPHVVETYDAGVLPDGRPYLVMELCQDGSLADRAPMPPREVAEIGQRTADALAAAHDLGVPHGDLTPADLLVRRHGDIGLAGFGLATLAPAHTAPGASGPEPPTARSDVHALTATLYALLAGSPPRPSGGGGEPADVPGLSREFTAILRRGLAADPADRYPDAVALRVDLSQLTVAELGTGRPTPSPSTGPGSSDPSPAAHTPAPATDPEPGASARGGVGAAVVVAVVLAAAVLVTAMVLVLT